MSEEKERYLGDGCYASFDGWQFCLRAPRGDGDHFIYLEPGVLASFEAYVAEVRRAMANREPLP